MATLTVSASRNYSRLLFTQNIDLIDFTNTFSNPSATATFSASQVDGVPILLDVAIDGNALSNRIVVNGGSVDASQWTFTNWSQTLDSITLTGGSAADTLTGSSVADTINGREGADIIEGRGGRDTLNGEGGNDIFVYSTAGHLVSGEVIDGGAGTDRIKLNGGITYDFRQATITSVERLEFWAVVQVSLSGTQLGAGAINLVKGHAGLDWMEISGSTIDLSAVTFTTWTDGGDVLSLLGDGGAANAITGSSKADTISGGSLGDTLSGRGGDDTITGFGGADIMSGGGGNDTFAFSAASNIVAGEVIAGNAGTDTIQLQAAGFYDFRSAQVSGIEVLRFANAGCSVTMSGDQIGGSLQLVVGRANSDFLITSGSVDLSGVTFQNWSSLDGIVLEGLDDVDDVLIGSAMTDIVSGGSGDDVVRGGAGGDSLQGEAGFDTLSYEGSLLGVAIDLGNGTASGGDAQGDQFGGFEGVIGSGANDTLSGTGNADTIDGGAGNDVITGRLGADTLKGGSGNDTFAYAATGDAVLGESIDGGGGNQDSIQLANVQSQNYDFRGVNISNVERLVLLQEGGATFDGLAFGSGAGLINTIVGSAGDNSLQLHGSSIDLSGVTLVNWTSPVFIFSGGDSIGLIGGGTDDTLVGSSGTDVLYGLLGSDTLNGGAGSDFIFGGLGQDFLTGGADADLFVFTAANESAVGASRDRILDFTQGSDLLFFDSFDAIPGGGQDEFVFIGTAGFVNGEAGRLRYFQNNAGNTIVEGEINGDAAADFQIQINGLVNLAAADFYL